MEKFFISRPIFAISLAIVIVLVGLISILNLPIEQYPDITPPVVEVSATYDGASRVKDYFGWESGTAPFRIFAALLLSAIVITSISVWHYRRNKS